ncbi:kinesin motor domain-containing protein [Apiospora phragmitis]|uniref:Kinesin-like protein n=1 Tax=Apiospora phragmitis TaxID=2905665 RepID=A0ABR1TSV9_9PEZI
MATIPRPSRPSVGPPTSALPALPVPKTRKSTGNLHAATRSPSTPRSGLRAPSSNLPPPAPAPTSALPTPKGAATPNGKTIRKTVSINSFPQPPKGDSRISSLPPSPLSGATGNSRKTRISTAPKVSHGVPSLLNGGGDSKSVLSSNNVRNSDGLISIASPPQSRSSSAQDSYSTSATTYDDPTDLSSTPTNDKRTSKSLDGKGNVIVSVRVRPDAGASDQGRVEGEWMVDGRKSLVSYRGKEGGDYHYDNVFATHDDNSRVYDHTAKRLVRRVMEGYHGTVFAYGMTGTGKTFSMQGTASSPGVIPLAITDIFSYIRETPSREFLLRVSYLEIYNEKIHDLLSMSTGGGVGGAGAQEEIKLREDSKRGVYATPLKEEIVQSPTQLLRVIARGDQARRTASTQFNARSSRSHAVVQIVVESRERMPASGADNKRSGLVPGGVRVSTLSLIDLAGSEKAAETKERRQEGGHINKSLLTLGNVISKLSDAKKKDGAPLDTKHLPYRDSKLTRLLQGALSGNSLVSILCTIQIGAAGSAASSNSHTAETINTLKFAARAKNSIVSHAKKAEEALGAGGEGGARVLLERYQMEILELRSQLETQVKNKPAETVEEEEPIKEVVEERLREKEAEARHEEQMLEMQLARTALKERIDHLNKLILSSKSIGVNSSGAYSALGIHPRYSQSSLAPSVRTSIAASSKSHPIMERTSSMNSSSSTIGRRSNLQRRSNSGEPSTEEDDSFGEYGDGFASLAAQNQALQSDLADKNRYIATLEKRLLHARRASSSRASVGFSAPNKGIMVGEDHSVSAALKEKDAEIAELRARLDDKDRMLGALRNAARSRDAAEGLEKGAPKPEVREVREGRTSLLYEQAASPPPSGALPDPPMAGRKSASPTNERKRPKSVDEMSRILDEMIQEKVESGHVVRGMRGSVRIASDGRKIHVPAAAPEAATVNAEPNRESPTVPRSLRRLVPLEA